MCSKLKALLPECMTNAGVRCQGAIARSLDRNLKVFTSVSLWCQEKSTKYGKEVVVTVKIIGIFMFTFDLGTDSFTGVHYINDERYYAGIIILIFTFLPMLCISLRLVIFASGRKSTKIRFVPSLTATVCSPILPLGWLVMDVVASIGKNDSDNENENNNAISEDTRITAEKAARLIKMFVAVGESYPQTIIQLFMIFVYLAAKETVGVWLWVSIAVSLTSLSFAVSTGYLNAEAASSSKVGFFLFGMLALGTRQVVCCVYSLYSPVFWLVPFCTQLVSSIIIQCISSKCHSKWGGLLIFVLTEAYNSFTISGLLTSTIYLGFAIGGFFLLTVKPYLEVWLTVALVLASLSWTFNVLFTVIPQCKDFRNDWLKKPDVETTQPDAEGAISGAEVAQLGAEGAISGAEVAQLGAVVETQPDSRKNIPYDKGIRDDSVETYKYVKETQHHDNEILPDNENEHLDAKDIHVEPRKPVSETEESYM